jgi:hypothetical protein
VVEVNDKESNPYLEYDPENIENINMTDVDPTSTVVTAKIQQEEPIDPEEGECLFHS